MTGVLGNLPWGDPMAGADYMIDELKDAIACPTCKSRQPVRVEGTVCSDCAEFPRCAACNRWVGDGTGFLPASVVVEGFDGRLCMPCWEAIP